MSGRIRKMTQHWLAVSWSAWLPSFGGKSQRFQINVNLRVGSQEGQSWEAVDR